MKDAKLRVDFAQIYVTEVARDFPPVDALNTNGVFAYRHAVRAENSALREYARVVRIYRDLTVNGVIPDESEWLKTRDARTRDGEDDAK